MVEPLRPSRISSCASRFMATRPRWKHAVCKKRPVCTQRPVKVIPPRCNFQPTLTVPRWRRTKTGKLFAFLVRLLDCPISTLFPRPANGTKNLDPPDNAVASHSLKAALSPEWPLPLLTVHVAGEGSFQSPITRQPALVPHHSFVERIKRMLLAEVGPRERVKTRR